MDKIIQYISYVLVFLSIAITVINFLITKFKKISIKDEQVEEIKELKSEISTSEKLVDVIRKIIPNAIKVAEASGIADGTVKKMIALSNILLECNNNDFDYKANSETINQVIEEFIDLTKKVNSFRTEEQKDDVKVSEPVKEIKVVEPVKVTEDGKIVE